MLEKVKKKKRVFRGHHHERGERGRKKETETERERKKLEKLRERNLN